MQRSLSPIFPLAIGSRAATDPKNISKYDGIPPPPFSYACTPQTRHHASLQSLKPRAKAAETPPRRRRGHEFTPESRREPPPPALPPVGDYVTRSWGRLSAPEIARQPAEIRPRAALRQFRAVTAWEGGSSEKAAI